MEAGVNKVTILPRLFIVYVTKASLLTLSLEIALIPYFSTDFSSFFVTKGTIYIIFPIFDPFKTNF